MRPVICEHGTQLQRCPWHELDAKRELKRGNWFWRLLNWFGPKW